MKHKEQTWKVNAEVEQPQIICFPHGMVGFPDENNYVMLNSGHGDIVCMQSTERAEVSFLVTHWDNHRLGRQPEPTLEQQECLQYSDKHNILWLLVLNPFATPEWVLANMRAPVAINMDTALGMQCIQANPQLDLHFHWMRQPRMAQQAA